MTDLQSQMLAALTGASYSRACASEAPPIEYALAPAPTLSRGAQEDYIKKYINVITLDERNDVCAFIVSLGYEHLLRPSGGDLILNLDLLDDSTIGAIYELVNYKIEKKV